MVSETLKVVSHEVAAITARSALSRPVATQGGKEIDKLNSAYATGPEIDAKQPEDYYDAKDGHNKKDGRNNQEPRNFPINNTPSNLAEAIEASGVLNDDEFQKIPLFDAIRNVAKYESNIEVIENSSDEPSYFNRFLS